MVLLTVLGLTALLVVLTPVLGRWLGRAAGWPIAGGLLALGGVVAVQDSARGLAVSVPWMPTIDVELHLRLDGLSHIFALLVLVIGGLVLAYSARYHKPGSHTGFYALMTLFAAAMLGLVLTDDVVVLFVLWEITTLCSFFLIGLSGPSAHQSAVRVLLTTFIGGLSLLVAVVLMIVYTGTTQLSVIFQHSVWQENDAFTTAVAVLIIVAGFTKSAQFPFHYWLPDAMAASTPVSAYLHAAAMVKAGVYLLLRFSTVLSENLTWNAVLITFGLLTMVLGAVFAMQQYDLKELLAYSTVSQLGLLVATIGVGTPEALSVAVMHTVAHALFKGSLFMLIGIIDKQNGTRDIRELSGLRAQMPWTLAATVVAALSMAGVPPLLGFISKEGVFVSMLEAPGPPWAGVVAGLVAMLGSVFTFGYSMRILWGAFGGRQAGETAEASWLFLAPATIPAAAGLALGIGAPLLNTTVSNAATAASGEPIEAHLTLWHGLTVELLMSSIVIAAGVMLVLGRHRLDAAMNGPLWPGSGVQLAEACRTGSIAIGRRVGDLTRTDSPALHLAIPAIVLVALAGAGLSAGLDLPRIAGDTSQATDWLLVVLLVVAVGTATTTRSRLAAVVLVGGAGFVVALWYYVLGASDVALTQLLVEILTVVVIVLVLRRLPRTFHRVSRSRNAMSALIALAAGVATTLAVYTFTGRRELSSASQYFLQNAENLTGGTNVVNTILVDFRALDTLGELTVLGLAGVAIVGVLNSARLVPSRRVEMLETMRPSAIVNATQNVVFVQTLSRVIGPAMFVLSVYFLLRGHNNPGGGFIAGLVAGAGFAIAYLSAPSDRSAPIRWPYIALVSGGVLLATGIGLVGFADGGFLRPLHADLPVLGGIPLTSTLVFDVGVYLAVLGAILTALNRLGIPEASPTRSTEQIRRSTTEEVR